MNRDQVEAELRAALETWDAKGLNPVGHFVVRPLKGYPGILIAKGQGLSAILLIEMFGEDGALRSLPFSALEISMGSTLEITLEDGAVRRGTFALVGLRDAQSPLLESFIVVLSSIVSTLGSDSNSAEVWSQLELVGELFAAQERPSRADIVGLAGELLLISTSADVPSVARAWHPSVTDRYDFAFDSSYLEVKTTTSAQRCHFFSASQLEAADRRVVVASIQIIPSASGLSLLQLSDSICGQLAQPDAQKFRNGVFSTIGSDLEALSDFRFSLATEQSIRFYDAAYLPAVSASDLVRVSNIRFQLLLDGLEETRPPAAVSSLEA